MTSTTKLSTLQPEAAEVVVRPRGVERLVAGMPTSDGAGVKLTRVLTQTLQRRLDIQSDSIPEFTTPDGVTVRVIAGASHGVAGAMQRDTTLPLYLDLQFAPDAVFRQALPALHNAFVYVYRGALDVGDSSVPVQRMAILKNTVDSDGVVLRATGSGATRALLIAGRPLNEPIAQYGPFVMNTKEEIFQAVEDFRSSKFAAAA